MPLKLYRYNLILLLTRISLCDGPWPYRKVDFLKFVLGNNSVNIYYTKNYI
jgi:hypothetical protein